MQSPKAPRRLKSFLEKTLTRANPTLHALLALLLLTACNPTPTPELHVFAAASLREALTETADAFQRANPKVQIVPNFAGSQLLRLQIESGARADLVISANPDHLEALHHSGLLAAPPTVVATNQLILAVPAANPAGISGLQDLTQPNRRVVMAAESVPAGAYARQMLAAHAAATGQPGFADTVLQRVISFETNVRQVAAKLELAEADTGFVYRTDVLASNGRLHVIQTPPQVRVTATYPAAVLRDAPNSDLAQRFLTFLRTPQAQAILTRHGFGAPA
ncbi:MAG: molybdate ABC transporter substrate-binding protein [Chloroflexota bacterium]|nr:molybdate ABC transporter substrate-binding protein [Chloroflexota bacterium]